MKDLKGTKSTWLEWTGWMNAVKPIGAEFSDKFKSSTHRIVEVGHFSNPELNPAAHDNQHFVNNVSCQACLRHLQLRRVGLYTRLTLTFVLSTDRNAVVAIVDMLLSAGLLDLTNSTGRTAASRRRHPQMEINKYIPCGRALEKSEALYWPRVRTPMKGAAWLGRMHPPSANL